MILINNVNAVAGTVNLTKKPLPTYSAIVVDFLNELSQELLISPEIRIYPDISAFAFWCRKANIKKLKQNYTNLKYNLGRGICFHITPSNIPINFAFSYVFSLLAGNSNIVRIPSKQYKQVDFLCKIINNILKSYKEIYDRTVFVKYSREKEDISQHFSSISDCRMIWGGDLTISKFKNFSTKLNSTDICFSDKYSICIIDADAILKANSEEMNRLANNFYNDTYLMDQNACSSPQLIYWMNDSKEGRDKFWKQIVSLAKIKYDLEDAVAINKFTKSCMDSISLENICSISSSTNIIHNVELSKVTKFNENLRGSCGYFYEYSLNNYNEIFEIVSEKYQTVTYYGIDVDYFTSSLLKSSVNGISRVVPIGKALEIGIEWDGHDILQELSRKILVI